MKNRLNYLLPIFFLCNLLIFIQFIWQSHKTFSLADEGFLWYGVQRVMAGETPILDFMSYDPGRYYWSAAIMQLLGNNGIIALRITIAIFQLIGLVTGMILIANNVRTKNVLFLILSSLALLAWMFPRHKLFDITFAILLIYALTILCRNARSRNYFLTGIFVGLMAFFGRNHAVYGSVGSLCLIIWLNINSTERFGLLRNTSLWTIGVFVGFMPILLMMLFVPNFAIAYWESVRFIIESKATNLPLPIPWPWQVAYASLPPGESLRGFLVGLFFIGTISFGILSAIYVVWSKFKRRAIAPELVASTCLALPYAQYAYSRADVGHLAHGIFPLLIGILVILAPQPAKIKWPFTILLFSASLFVMYKYHPGMQCFADQACAPINISNSMIEVDPTTAQQISLLEDLTSKYTPNGESFFVTPHWPGAYALFQRKSPSWEIYAILPRNANFEENEIARIKLAKPQFALILDIPLDGHQELRFMNTHPLINQYILNNYERLTDPSLANVQIYNTK